MFAVPCGRNGGAPAVGCPVGEHQTYDGAEPQPARHHAHDAILRALPSCFEARMCTDLVKCDLDGPTQRVSADALLRKRTCFCVWRCIYSRGEVSF